MAKACVFLVGAGPGDPSLITLKGMRALERADVVVYDYLSNPALMSHAPAQAERIYVGKRKGKHHSSQETINALLVEKALEGKRVVRLKGGDPYIFGRGGEEALCLHQHGIPFEVVPGVTSGIAAGAYAGIPLTHRDYTTTLGMITGHENPDKGASALDWEKFATGMGTLVFYMGMANLPLIVENLCRYGRSPETPVAVIRWATTPRQQTLVSTLGEVVQDLKLSGIKPPALIIVGEVVSLREQLRWFDNRPLFGKRILNTRPPGTAAAFTAQLEEQGAEVISIPTIETVPPPSWQQLDAAIAELSRMDYLILTSATAVNYFFERLEAASLDARALHGLRIVVVGPKTGEALSCRGIRPDLIPAHYRAEGVVELLRSEAKAGQRVLYPRAELARDLISRELGDAGLEICAPLCYSTRCPEQGSGELRRLLEEEQIDIISFTSSSTVDNLVEMVGEGLRPLLENLCLCSIGPLTTATALSHGLSIAVEPQDSTLEAMVEALLNYFKDPKN